MILRKQILLMVTSLLAIALLPTVGVLTWIARKSLLAQSAADGILIAQLVSRTAAFAEQIPNSVEDAIGKQMVSEATLTAHLVAIATKAGLSPQEINSHLVQIAQKTVIDEFWITNEKGYVYLKNIPEIDFTFNPDPKKQPQAHVFWPLLTGKKQVVVQEARKREIDNKFFKYVGVAGIDRPRIVEIGYSQAFLLKLRQQVGLTNLINLLLASKNVSAIRIVDTNLQTLASGTVPGLDISQPLSESDTTRLRRVISQKQTDSYLDGSWLKVMAPLVNEKEQVTGATLVYLPTDNVHQAIRRQLELAIAISAIVLLLGVGASVILSRRITQPILSLSQAAKTLSSGNWEQKINGNSDLAHSFASRNDELGVLARVFNSMADELQKSFTSLEAKYQDIYENAITGIFQTTLDGYYLSANPALARIYGYDSPEDLMENLGNIQGQLYVNSNRREEFIRIMGEQGFISDFESQVYRKDGSTIWISENARMVRDDKGTLLYYEGFVEDISQRKQAEEALQESLTKLGQANQEITHLNERLQAENLRMSAELEITRKLQQMILPKESELKAIEKLEIAGFMEPASEVGGDYYDVLNHNGIVKIGIGDVTGHGLESGVLMIMVQTAVRTLLASNETDPVKFLNVLNRIIYDNVQRMNSDKNLTLVLLDYQNGTLRLSGQHEEIIVVRSGGIVERIDTIDLGFPIGLEADIADFVGEVKVQLNTGDVVVLYTDGITEAENLQKELYGLERLIEVIKQNWQRSASEIRQAAIDDVRRHIGNQKVYDDITLVVFKQK